MKSIAVIVAALALTGCAHNQWVVPAAVGAVVGVAVHEAARQPQYHPQPQIIYAPPVYQRHCQMVPIFGPYGHQIGYRTVCY